MRRVIAKIKPFFNYTLVNLVSKVLISLIVLCFPILFNSEDYGEFVLAYSFFQLIVVFVTAGHYEQIIPDKNSDIRKIKMKTSLYSSIVIMIGIFCLFKIVSNAIFNDYIILSICVSGVFLGYNLLFVKYLFLEKKEHIATKFSFLFSLVFYLPAFIFTYFYRSWNNFFLISSIIGLSSTLIIAKIYLTKSRINLKEFLSFQKKAIPYVIIAFIGWFGGYGYNYLVDSEFSIEIVGAFGFVLSISNFILVISNSINLVWSSRLFNNFKFDSSQNKSDLKLWGGVNNINHDNNDSYRFNFSSFR